MFREKNREAQMVTYKEIIDNHMNDNEEYELYRQLYYKIKQEYIAKINSRTVNIPVEKIRLQSKSEDMAKCRRSILYRIKYSSKDKNEKLIYDFCLKVLEDIEKEIEAEKQKLLEQAKEKATQQDTDRNEAKVNVMTEIMLPAAFEVAASIVKTKGFMSKVFGRKKKKEAIKK